MAPSAREGFFDGFLGRLAANVVGMAGVAVCTIWVLDRRDGTQQDEAAALLSEVETARFERDRMSRLNHELARELHEAGVAAEVARWQLRYTEERLRRTEAESQSAVLRASAVRHPTPGAVRVRGAVGSGSLPTRSQFEPLDAQAEAHLAQAVQRLAEGGAEGLAGVSVEGSPVAEAQSSVAEGRALELDPLDPIEIAELASVGFSGRSAALLEWRAVVTETLDAECGTRSGARTHACRTVLERRLFPYSERAVRCLTSGNAEPDYVAVTEVERLPSHSVPLDRGALILCDGALENL